MAVGSGDRAPRGAAVALMGRTVPTMTQIVAQEEASFAPFRRALRREDREVLDRLFAAARQHAAPAAHMSRPVPFEAILVAMLLEVAKQVYALQGARIDPPIVELDAPGAGADMPAE